jgi:hypothetical protein
MAEPCLELMPARLVYAWRKVARRGMGRKHRVLSRIGRARSGRRREIEARADTPMFS